MHGLMTQNPSLATASNIFIITEEEAKAIGRKFSGKFSEARVLNKVFENTYAMIIVEVDRDRELVTFFINGTEGSTTLSLKEIKSSNKGKGPDVFDIFKSLQMGMSPGSI
jgi:hypothetical protein